PTLESDYPGEQALVKLPKQFRPLFKDGPVQLSEEIGKPMALWAQGSTQTTDDLIQAYEVCGSKEEFDGLEERRRAVWGKTARPDRARLKTASDQAAKRFLVRADDGRAVRPDTAALIRKMFNDLGMEFEETRTLFDGLQIEDDEKMTEAQGQAVLQKLHALQ